MASVSCTYDVCVCVQPSWAAVDILLVIAAGVEAFVAVFAAALACRSICSGRLNTAPVRSPPLSDVCVSDFTVVENVDCILLSYAPPGYQQRLPFHCIQFILLVPLLF